MSALHWLNPSLPSSRAAQRPYSPPGEPEDSPAAPTRGEADMCVSARAATKPFSNASDRANIEPHPISVPAWGPQRSALLWLLDTCRPFGSRVSLPTTHYLELSTQPHPCAHSPTAADDHSSYWCCLACHGCQPALSGAQRRLPSPRWPGPGEMRGPVVSGCACLQSLLGPSHQHSGQTQERMSPKSLGTFWTPKTCFDKKSEEFPKVSTQRV